MLKQRHRSLLTVSATVLLSTAALLGCSNKPAESPQSDTSDTGDSENLPGQDPKQANIEISPQIAEACGISETDAYFPYNSAKVSKSADLLFTKLADCFTTGPLAGKSMKLVGHADPRGEDEFNMTLGGRRADNVSDALEKKGLPESQMQTTSRGEMDAVGTDEASWAKDRKVGVFLAN